MSVPMIEVESLGKRYVLNHANPAGEGLRHVLDRMLTAPGRWAASRMRREAPKPPAGREEFWALRDVSFRVERGDVVGVVGRNGAGKSTLLKVLSRITEPTTGRVRLRGRVASLLEVGTGFHPELTGRENIFLNGAILGMSRAEIRAKFDEIVAFSEVEKFLDTPVKRYSSGMYVRLAFSVAAHLEPDILVIDEVLAVGDAQFQKKCLGKMGEVSSRDGRTVLFVSHNMAAVSALCSKALVLHQGRVTYPCGPVEGAVDLYLSELNEGARLPLRDRADREGRGDLRATGFSLHDFRGKGIETPASGQDVEFRIHYEAPAGRPSGLVNVYFSFLSAKGHHISLLSTECSDTVFQGIPVSGSFRCRVPRLPLVAGNYLVNIVIRRNGDIEDWVSGACAFSVEDGDFFGLGHVMSITHSGALFDQSWALAEE